MKEIPGYPGYSADSVGNIFSDRSGIVRLLVARLHKNYLHVQVTVGDTQRKIPVHQLVLTAFGGPRPTPAHETRHLDGDRLNNTPLNLAWGTRAENVADAISHGTHVCLRRGPEHNSWKNKGIGV